jgi:hypothetical protein
MPDVPPLLLDQIFRDISTLDSDSLPIHVQILHRLLSSSSPTLLSLNIPQAAVKGVPLLGLACYLGDLEIVRLLLGEDSWKTAEDESGGRGKGWVLVDGKDAKGGTPLMCKRCLSFPSFTCSLYE